MRRLTSLSLAVIAGILASGILASLSGCMSVHDRMNYDRTCQKHYDVAYEEAVDIDTVWVDNAGNYTYAGAFKEAAPTVDPYAGDVILRSIIYKPVYRAMGEYFAADGTRMVEALEMTPVKAWVVDGASVKVKVRIFAKTVILN